MDSLGSNNILFLGSTFKIKYFKAPKPIVLLSSSFSDGVNSSILPSSLDNSVAFNFISEINSSPSTTVPSRLFIFPDGKSTIP